MTNRKTILRWQAAALAVLATAACGDTAGPEVIDQATLLAAAVVAGDATLEDIGIMGGAFGFAHEGQPGMGNGGRMGGGQPGKPGGQRGIGGALSGTRDVTFYDASGATQDAYDALTTERMETLVDVAGEVSRDNWSATIARTRDMVITGLAGENATRTVNGSGTEDVNRSRLLEDGETSTATIGGSFTFTDLVVPVPGSAVHYPLSGTITRNMTVVVVNGREGDVDKTVNVVITFDGSETATGTINGETFEIDLTAREGHFPLRKGFGRRFGG